MKKRSGFTLIEVLVTVVIFSLISFAILNIFDFQMKSFSMTSTRAQTQGYIRGVSESIASKIEFSTEVYLLEDAPTAFSSADEYAYIYSKDGSIIYKQPKVSSRDFILNPDTVDDDGSTVQNTSQSLEVSFMMENVQDPRYISFEIRAEENSLGNNEYLLKSVAKAENTKVNVRDISVFTKVKDKNGNDVEQATGKAIKFMPTGPFDLANIKNIKLNDTWYNMMQKAINDANAKVDPITGEIIIDSYKSDGGVTTDNMYIAGITDHVIQKGIPDGHPGKTDKYNYSVSTKIAVSGPDTGYRILINGATRKDGSSVLKQKQISGYAFEYEPNLGGFRLVKVEQGKIDESGRPLNKDSTGFGVNFGGDNKLYTFDMIKNGNFDMSKDKNAQYDVNIKVITDPVTNNLTLKAVLTDKNGFSSKPMYFGDFGPIKMANGITVSGENELSPIDAGGGDSSNLTPSPQLGTQAVYFKKGKVSDESKVSFESSNFGIAPADAVKANEGEVVVSNEVLQTLDIGFTRGIKSGMVDKTKFKVTANGNLIPIQSVSVDNTTGRVQIAFVPEKKIDPNTGKTITIKYDLTNPTIEYKDGIGGDGIVDDKDNPIEDFTFNPII